MCKFWTPWLNGFQAGQVQIMAVFRSGSDWFVDLFGFEEGTSYQENRAQFTIEGEVLVCPSAPEDFKRQHVGMILFPFCSKDALEPLPKK
jgi:hypothetical protein